MEERGLGCLIVFGIFGRRRNLCANIKYLSNVSTEGYLVFPADDEPTLYTFLSRVDPEAWVPDWRSGHPIYSNSIKEGAVEMKIHFYETQMQLLDKLVSQGDYGKTREDVLHTVVLEHAKDLLSGGTPFDLSPGEVIEVDRPDYGKIRYDKVLEPVTGVAVPVYKGEVLKIMQVEGGTCADFNAYNLYDYKEHLDNGMTRCFRHHPARGDFIWTNSPRSRPIYAILEMPETCKVYIIGHRCNSLLYEKAWGFTDHANCQSTFAEAIREWGMTPDEVHDSFNLWMNAEPDPTGDSTWMKWNPAKKEDSVEFLALFDTLAVPIICGMADLSDISNYRFNHIQVQICEASPATLNLVGMIDKRLSSYKSQMKLEDEEFKVKDIPVQRKLKQVANYRPEYRHVPKMAALNVDLGPAEEGILQSLIKSGFYGNSLGDALVASFIRWYNAHHITWSTKLLIR